MRGAHVGLLDRLIEGFMEAPHLTLTSNGICVEEERSAKKTTVNCRHGLAVKRTDGMLTAQAKKKKKNAVSISVKAANNEKLGEMGP